MAEDEEPKLKKLKVDRDSMHSVIPNELWLRFLSYLRIVDICMMGATSRRYNKLSKDPSLWENLVFDWKYIRKSLEGVYAVIERTPKVHTLRVTNKYQTKVNEIIIASLVEKAKKSLKVLILDTTVKVKNEAVKKFESFTKLEVLEFNGDFLNSIGANAIGKLRNLKKLKIEKCGENGEGNLTFTISLNTIGPKNTVINEMVKILSLNQPYLEHLYLGSCKEVQNDTLKDLTLNCPKLTRLNLMKAIKLNESSFNALANCIYLQCLTLSFCRITNSSMQKIVDSCSALKYLLLGHCEMLGEEGFSALGNCSRLQFLSLSACKQLTSGSLMNIAEGCKELRYINLWFCWLIQDIAIMELSHNCPNLQFLNVGLCTELTEVGFSALGNCKKLQYLALRFCKVSDSSLQKIAKGCHDLRHLDLTACSLVSDDGVQDLVRNCPHLQNIQIWQCKRLSKDVLNKLQNLSLIFSNDSFSSADPSGLWDDDSPYINEVEY